MNVNESNRSKRIASNTIILFVRMAILMVINLITIRLVLMALGIEDYGIYNAVAGVVTMLNCVSSVLGNSSLRYYSYYLGLKENDNLKRVFSVSLDVYIILLCFIFIVGETIGLWFVNHELVIPDDRLNAANWTYQLSIFTFVATVLPMPYLSAILAHEKMEVYSVFTTCEYAIKLGLAFLLSLLKGDVLIYYALFQFVAQALLMIAYVLYGKLKFQECQYRPFHKDTLHKEVLSFSSWTLFGTVASIGMNQVMTILYNVFWGPILTAAWAISLQLNTALSSFSNNFIQALRPPMIKSFSESNNNYLMKLFKMGNKFIFYSLVLIAVPLILEMDSILHAWLKVTEIVTIRYSQLIVISFLILALSNPITIIIQALGKVKQYHLRVEVFMLLCPVLTFVLFKMGFNSYFGYFVMIITLSLAHLVRVLCLKRYYKFFNVREYFLDFIVKAFLISFFILVFAYCVHVSVEVTWLRFLLVSLFSGIATVSLTYFVGMSKEERYDIVMFTKKILKRK